MRRFVRANSDKVVLGLGSLGFTGAITIAAVVRPTVANVSQSVIRVGSSSTVGYGLSLGTGGEVQLGVDNVGYSGPLTVSAGSALLLAVTKVAGTSLGTAYAYSFANQSWSTGTLGSVPDASGTPTTRATFGSNEAGNAAFLDADLALVAVWNAALTQSQLDSLARDVSPRNWAAYVAPKGIWRPDGMISVVDLTGGGANQTSVSGTSVAPDEFPLLNKLSVRQLPHLPFGPSQGAPILFLKGRSGLYLAGPPAAATNIKTVTGSDYVGGTGVKTVMGLAKASIKSLIGLT